MCSLRTHLLGLAGMTAPVHRNSPLKISQGETAPGASIAHTARSTVPQDVHSTPCLFPRFCACSAQHCLPVDTWVTPQAVPDYFISIHAYTPICSPMTPFVCITWRECVSFNIAGLACPIETNLNRCWQCLICLPLYNPPQSRALCHSQYQEPNKYVEMNNWSCHCVTWYYFLQDRAFNSYISAWMWHTVTYLTDVSYLLLEAM